jgi:TolB-like protein/DNA-binding winged helix-turn-helix (wHTH) protein
VFSPADVCDKWTVAAFLLECGYRRIAIQIRYLGKVILRVSPLGKLREMLCEGSGIRQRGVCDNVDETSLRRLSADRRRSDLFPMQDANHSPRRLRFGVFEADLRVGELTKQGKRLPLQEQPFQLLAMLVQRPGELVSREELCARIWPQTIVDFDHGLNKGISKIRDALGDSAENPRFIETVARRGYRFLADVAAVQDRSLETAAGDPAVQADAGPLARPEAGISSRGALRALTWRLMGFGLALVLAAALSWVLYNSRNSAPTIRSLAVLPLKNLSGDVSQDYFTDGMTEELITQLGQISALRVISSRSVMLYKGVDKPLADIARELSVQAVLEGGVLRSGDRVRITAQLIRVPADEQMWAQSYEGELRDTLALQSEVAQAVA